MTRLHHAAEPGQRARSRTRRIIGGLRQRMRTAVIRGGLGPVDASVGDSLPVLRDYPYRVDR